MRTSGTVRCTGRPVEIQKCGKSPCPGTVRRAWADKGLTFSFLFMFVLISPLPTLSTAKCQLVCVEGRPSEDCSRCTCDDHVLHGEVRAVTGVPVAEAWVALDSQPKVIRALTDAKGQFRLEGICSSSSTLISIRKEKFTPVTVSTSSNGTAWSWVRAVLRSAGGCEQKRKINIYFC